MFLEQTVWLGGVLALAASGCGVEQRTLGEPCVKGEDCISTICSDQVCVAAPPLLDGEPPLSDTGASPPEDVASDRSRPPGDGAADAREAGKGDAGGMGKDASDAADKDAAEKDAARDRSASDGPATKDAKGGS